MDRTSEAEATRLIDRILQNPANREPCLRFFSNSINCAHAQGPSKWGVTLHDDRIRLNVGGVVVCTLQNDRLWLALDRESVSVETHASLEALIGWKWEKHYYRVIPSLAAFYSPSQPDTQESQITAIPHQQYIRLAAKRWHELIPRCQQAHSPGVLKAISAILGRKLPDPAYDLQSLLFAQQERQLLESGAFDPNNLMDARERVIASIVRRQGQPAFRSDLIDAYSGQCAISDCNVIAALEAAHIKPYMGTQTNYTTNGLLLRADLHTLFDQKLIAIDPETMTVLLAPILLETCYQQYAGKKIRLPDSQADRPDKDAIEWHREESRLTKAPVQ